MIRVHTYIIAEVGCNHNGSLDIAKQMVRLIAESGADAAKFQVFHAGELASKKAESAAYQKANLNSDESQYEMLKHLELGEPELAELKELCSSLGLDFFATPFDCDSVDILERLGVDRYKIGSGDVTDKLLLEKVGQTCKPVILSTGMSTYQEIDEALSWLEERGPRDITLLHCTSNYPTSYDDVNMLMMDTLARRYGRPVGYSDHTVGLEVPVMAVARGASVIEKHVTLDCNMPGPDHKASLELARLPELVSMIRHVEVAFGDSEKQVEPTEEEIRRVARKSLVARHDLACGHVLEEADLASKRPGTGIEPKRLGEVIGKKLVRDVSEDSPLTVHDIEGLG